MFLSHTEYLRCANPDGRLSITAWHFAYTEFLTDRASLRLYIGVTYPNNFRKNWCEAIKSVILQKIFNIPWLLLKISHVRQ